MVYEPECVGFFWARAAVDEVSRVKKDPALQPCLEFLLHILRKETQEKGILKGNFLGILHFNFISCPVSDNFYL